MKRKGQFSAGKENPSCNRDMSNENHPNWKGDNPITKVGLHKWVRRHLPKPDLCQVCNEIPAFDLANITEIYNRDFSNWIYMCRRCHMESDGRLNNLIKSAEQRWLKRK
jgi:hypothetical protein